MASNTIDSYFIEIKLWPFTKKEYEIKINQLKKLAEENRILTIPEYTWFCKVYWCEHECWYVNMDKNYFDIATKRINNL